MKRTILTLSVIAALASCEKDDTITPVVTPTEPTIGELILNDDEIATSAYYGDTTITKLVFSGSYIGMSSFEGTSNLVDLTLDYGVVDIAQQAFYKSGIEGTLTIPSTVNRMGILTFANVWNEPEPYNKFTKAIFANDNPQLTTLSTGTFQACWNLQEVILPSSISQINGCAFYGCGRNTGELSVTIPSPSVVDVDTIYGDSDSNPFKGTGNVEGFEDVSITIYVPAELVDDYEADSNWKTVVDNHNCGEITFVAIP